MLESGEVISGWSGTKKGHDRFSATDSNVLHWKFATGRGHAIAVAQRTRTSPRFLLFHIWAREDWHASFSSFIWARGDWHPSFSCFIIYCILIKIITSHQVYGDVCPFCWPSNFVRRPLLFGSLGETALHRRNTVSQTQSNTLCLRPNSYISR